MVSFNLPKEEFSKFSKIIDTIILKTSEQAEQSEHLLFGRWLTLPMVKCSRCKPYSTRTLQTQK